MAEVEVTTRYGEVFNDPTWDVADIPEFVVALKSVTGDDFAIVLDVEDEQQMIIPWREVRHVRLIGCGHTDDWA